MMTPEEIHAAVAREHQSCSVCSGPIINIPKSWPRDVRICAANPECRRAYKCRPRVYARWGLHSFRGHTQDGLKIGKSTQAKKREEFWRRPGDCAVEAYLQARLTFDGYEPFDSNPLKICEWFAVNKHEQKRVIRDLNRYYAEAYALYPRLRLLLPTSPTGAVEDTADLIQAGEVGAGQNSLRLIVKRDLRSNSRRYNSSEPLNLALPD